MNETQPYSDVGVARAFCGSSLLNFTRHFFRATRNSGFIVNDHHRKICEALEDVMDGRTTRLIINKPPRYGKSLLVVINFIAYCFSKNPACEFIHLSKSDTLITTNARQIIEIMRTKEYQRLGLARTAFQPVGICRRDRVPDEDPRQ